ncbi:TPA: hypothetical protein U1C31_002323 [Streptococcus suis]|nr:hypothetical protein [Streptococcus suis]
MFSTNRDVFECTIGVFSSLVQTTEAIQQFVTFSDINRLIEANDLVTITKIEDYTRMTIAQKRELVGHNEDRSVKSYCIESITIERYKLAYQDVNDFLSAYYTKKDLGTNRNRYKPFMTENLYKQEVSKEEEAVSQTYKGYVVDFEFKEADIYINTKTNIALVQVTYTNTLLEKKDNYEKAQKNVRNRTILKLSYIRDKEGELAPSSAVVLSYD